MRFLRRGLLYGLAVWFVPFALSCALYPVKRWSPALFDSLMAVIVAAATVIFSVICFLRVKRNFFGKGAVLGFLWPAMCVAIDLPLMLPPPMNFTVGHYFADVGVTYLMIPVITLGVALAAAGHVEVRQRLIKLDRKTEVPEFVPQL